MPKKPRPRVERRAALRAASKLQSARERLFDLEPGGSAAQPLSIPSAAVVETHAESVACPRCDGKQEVVEHVAVVTGGQRLREARLRCRMCGSRRSLWFRIDEPRLN